MQRKRGEKRAKVRRKKEMMIMKYGEKEEQKKEVALRKERDEFVRKALHYLEFLIHLSLPLPLPLPLLVCLSVCLTKKARTANNGVHTERTKTVPESTRKTDDELVIVLG